MGLQIFKNEEFGSIRTLELNDEPWFVGKDIAEVLGYAKPRNAISSHVDEEDKKDAPIQGNLGGTQNMTVINESGLYSLILSSKLPTAKKFKRWVTSEVLPAIRKHGAYMTDQKALELVTNPQALGDLLLQAGEQLKQKELIIQELKPKALFADAVAVSTDAILIGQLAKLLHQNGVEIGQRRLFAWMRENGYLCKSGQDYNLPTQKAMELKLFKIKERTVNNPDGSVRLTKTTLVTGKGQQYFVNKFLSQKGES